jgi:DNA-directed RNA polymerase subunit RPC12/RpoP
MPKAQEQIRSIPLRLAYAWDCPDCGREVFERGIVPEMAPEDLAKLREEHGVEPWMEGDFLLAPEEVKCPHCGSRFSVANLPGGDEDEDHPSELLTDS